MTSRPDTTHSDTAHSGTTRSGITVRRRGAFAGTRVIAGLQLRRRIRDRSALLQGVVAPILLAVIISTAFGGGRSFSTTIGVVDLDDGRLGAALVDGPLALDDGPAVEASAGDDDVRIRLVPLEELADARDRIDRGDLPAAIVIPNGFADSIGTDPLPIEVLVDPGRALPGDLAASIATRVAATVDARQLVLATALTAAPDLATQPGLAVVSADAADVDPPVTLGASAFGEGFDPITYFAPSMAILFAFLTLGTGARTLIVERREGTLARIRSTPVSDRAVLAGVTLSVLAVGLVSFLVVWLATSLVFGADWGDPVGVFTVIVATVLAVAGISTLVTGLARTEARADGLSSMLAFGFALVGGGFLRPGDLPAALDRVALITPNRWALDAFAELSAGAGGVAAVATPVAVLTAIGLATGSLGLRLVRTGMS